MGVALTKLPPLLDPLPGGARMVNAIDYVVNWARANSLWPLVYGTSCCAIEMMAAGGSHHDWSRFGVEVARASPRQADLIILAGTIVEKLAERLVTLYEQMPAPKYVIAMGACTISGGPFYYDSYSVVKGADRLVPVDVFIPGCPPRPEALLYGIMQLQEVIKRDSIRNPAKPRPLFTLPFKNNMTETSKAWAEQEKAKDEAQKAAREEFKKNNPEFKGFNQPRVAKPDLPEVPRPPRTLPGLPAAKLLARVRELEPSATVAGIAHADAAAVEAMGPEYVLDLAAEPAGYLALVRKLRDDAQLALDFLIELTAVDWKDRFEVVVHLVSTRHGHKIFVRCALPRENAEIESLARDFRTAEWHEREVYDLFGIRFLNHPDLRRLFLEDTFPGHPLRKDFEDATRVVKRPY